MFDIDRYTSEFRVLPPDEVASFVYLTTEKDVYTQNKIKRLKAFDAYLYKNHISLDTLSENDVSRYMERMLQKYKTGTANVLFAAVRTFLAWLEIEGYEVPTCKNVWYQHFKGDVDPRSTLSNNALIKVLKSTTRYPINIIGLRDAIAVNLALRNGITTSELVAINVGDVEISGDKGIAWVNINKRRNGRPLAPEVVELIKKYLELRGNPADKEPLFISTSNNNRNNRMTTDGLRISTRKGLRNSGLPKELSNLGTLRTTNTLGIILCDYKLKEIEEIVRRNSEIDNFTNNNSRYSTALKIDRVLELAQG